MKVVVRSTVSECQFDALPKTPLRQVFDLMCKNLLIYEKWYFGLLYKDQSNDDIWIDQSKKALKDLTRTNVENLLFRVKFHPEDVEEELVEQSTVELFFSQVKLDIYKDEIFCPAETCVILAAYALQTKFGDFVSESEKQSVEKLKLIPERILKQHNLKNSDWQENVVNMWKKLQGLDKEDSMMEYLKLAQNLEMYGVTYFKIRNRKNTDLYLGVNALGMDIYKIEDKLNPIISFPWSEIKHLKYKDRKFIIKPVDKTAQDFIIFTDDPKMSKRIFNLGIGNHVLYVRKRKPDSQDLTAMKQKAKDARLKRQLQKQKIITEIQAREEVERREEQYKNQIESMKRDMEQSRLHLQEAQDTIKRLQEQLLELQQSKEELERQREELKEMMERLEQAKNMEAAEKRALEEEIQKKQLEVLRIQQEVEERDQETKRLQEEVEEAQRREEERKLLEEQKQREEEEESLAREAAERERQEKELEQVETDNALPEVVEINERLKEEVKLLQDKLNQTRDETQATDLDKIHQVNLLQNRNKYKTLADIRRGNTTRRVELFENL